MKLVKILLSILLALGVISGKVETSQAAQPFTPRLTEPSYDDPHWIKTTYGGLNNCIAINGTTSCLPNCVGYVWGRAYEILGHRPNLSINNAYQFWGQNINGGYYSYGQTPKLGAVICWGQADFYNANTGQTERTLGHVAIIEKIEGNYITFSESNYGGSRWELKTKTLDEIKRINGGNLQGFIYLGDFVDGPSKPVFHSDTGTSSKPITFKWAPCDNTDHYDLRIYHMDGTQYGETIYGIKGTSYSIQLEAGEYYATLSSVASNGAFQTSDHYIFTILHRAGMVDLKISNGTESVPTIISWDEAKNAVHYKLTFMKKQQDDKYRFMDETDYLTNRQYEIQLEPGDYKVKMTTFASNNAMTEGEYVEFKVITTPTPSEDGWCYTDYLPSNINNSNNLLAQS